jgi:AraC-like DNA-binding protein
MLRLVFGDLLARLRIWVGMAVVSTATALVTSVAVGDLETAVGLGGTVALALDAISGSVVLFTAVAAVIVLLSGARSARRASRRVSDPIVTTAANVSSVSAGYRELPAGPEVTDRVACLWWRAVGTDDVLIVPDGCLDLVWMHEELVLVGADQRPRTVPGSTAATTVGIRLRPGAAAAVLGRPAGEVLDQQVPAELMWSTAAGRLADDLSTAPVAEQLGHLQRFVATRPGIVDSLVLEAARLLGRSEDRVSVVADRLGVSERQLRRRVATAVGYGPKMLSRVLRLRRLPAMPGPSLSDLALQAGYASQAHMSDDVRALTGLTPVRFLEYLGRPPALA